MANIRLTQSMRETILSRLLKHAFEDREKEILRERHKLGNDIYNDVYSKDMRRKMKALPGGFLPTSRSMSVAFGGQRHNAEFEDPRPVAEDHNGYSPARSYDAKDEFSIRHFDIDKSTAALNEERGRAKVAVKAVLNACTTLKGFLEVWPEAAPFVEDFKKSSAPVLALTVSIKDLNKQLGLDDAA